MKPKYSESQLQHFREVYLTLGTDQERADYLWSLGIGGAMLNLAPNQYPDCEPHHKPCKYCGGTGKAVKVSENPNIITDWAIQCQSCGRKTKPTWSVRTAWRFWDDGEVPEGEQLNLFDMGVKSWT